MTKKDEPIESPYTHREEKVIRQHITGEGLLKIIFTRYESMVEATKKANMELSPQSPAVFVAGVMATLEGVGFEEKDTDRLALDLMKLFELAGMNHCDCENCEKNREILREKK